MVNKFSKSKKTTVLQRLTSWSYSRFAKWSECPAAAKFKFIDKRPEPQGPAMKRGDDIHEMADAFLKGKIKKLPKELELFKDEFAEAKRCKTRGTEEQWCFRKDWSETDNKDWDNIWLRVKTDLWILEGTTLHIIDHKTGKNRGGYTDQLELSALTGMIKFPHVKKVVVYLWFLDSGDAPEAEYEAKQLPALKKKWEKKIAPMLADNKFHPKPSPAACKWCAFKKDKGGPCKY